MTVYSIRVRPMGKGPWIRLSWHRAWQRGDWARAGWHLISSWPASHWREDKETDVESMDNKRRVKMDSLMNAIRRPAEPDRVDILDLINRLATCGVKVWMEGAELKVKGKLTDELRTLIKANREALTESLQERTPIREPEPWDQALANEYITQARNEFKALYEAVITGRGDVWSEAAFGLLVDSLSMLAEAVSRQDITVVICKGNYVAWLCNEVRVNLDRVRQPSPHSQPLPMSA